MKLWSDDEVRAHLTWSGVLTALEDAFQRRAEDPKQFIMPERVALQVPGGTYLTMPCADREGWFGVKQVSVLPDNPANGKSSVQAWYTLFDPTGTPALACDATLLTRWRTAAVSALAANHLVPAQAKRLLVVGTGSLAPWQGEAHAQVRNYETVAVWGRDADKAKRTADTLGSRLDTNIEIAPDLEAAVKETDVITVATTAQRAFIKGAWLRPGQHLDLVGAFVPEMAEADADAIKRADVFVDDLEAAKLEAGDLIQAQAQGWSFDLVYGDLGEVVTGTAGRGGPNRITLFKSVGLALEDLAVAKLLTQ